MEKIKARYILESLANIYNNTGISTNSIVERIEKVLLKNGDVAQSILDTNMISFGDNVQKLAEFKSKVSELESQEVI